MTNMSGMSHHHSHPASHTGHAHAPADFGTAFLIGIALNTAFVVIEFVFGVLSNSIALIADAGHNLSDVLGLAVAWIGSVLARRSPSARFTYGLKGAPILAALFNAVLLLVAVGAIAWEAAQRLFAPAPVAELTVVIVAGIGVVINTVTALLFMSGRKGDLNVRGAFLHMAADAAVSAGVVAAALVIMLTGWFWLDPAISLVIVAVIVWGTWGLLRESLALSLAAVPSGIAPDDVRAYLAALPGVTQVHDLHIWAMSTTETAMTAHLVMPQGHPGDAALAGIVHELKHRFGIAHPTLQIELGVAGACALEPDSTV
jgi:cobalt-zinc-cadmium efflux system protein